MRDMMNTPALPWLCALTLLVCACGAGDEPAEPAADDVADVAEDMLATPDAIDVAEDQDTGPAILGWSPTTIQVGQTACCLSLSQGRIVWAEDGDIFMVEGNMGAVELLVDHPAVQKDPVLSGDRVVWADDRGGDFDLYALDLATGIEEALVMAPGDQHTPSLHADRLVWVDIPSATSALAACDIWSMDLGGDDGPVQVTDDAFEQSFPHVHGDRVVWTDFRNDPDGQYMDPQGTAENNGDILGYDFATGEPFVVTEDLGKQLRPAIEGDTVVWLDWRDAVHNPIGVEPEPKYHNFKVYVRNLPDGEEIYLAAGGWQQPELWQRPGIHQGHVAWITDGALREGAETGVQISDAATGASVLVHELSGVLVGLDFRDGALGWIGGGELGVMPFEAGALGLED